MSDDGFHLRSPVSEKVLRDLARNISSVLPDLASKQSADGVKYLQELIEPIIDTANIPDLNTLHLAATSNALCAIVEQCQKSKASYVQEALLSDSIWTRIFNIYVHRFNNAKGKSMRQTLVTLSNLITQNSSPRATELKTYATKTFLSMICDRKDRIKVKPALQGLAYYLSKGLVSVKELCELYRAYRPPSNDVLIGQTAEQNMLKLFLTWVVHHDTSLSAGNLIKVFLTEARCQPEYASTSDQTFATLWIVPVTQMIQEWPDRIQEFKTHVFPYCFLPNISEYLQFLSYLHFDLYIHSKQALPQALQCSELLENGLKDVDEFKILLAAIETGKELKIVRDNEDALRNTVDIREGVVYIPDRAFGHWMSHSEPDVRLAGMYLSVYAAWVTKPLNHDTFELLRHNLIHLHTDTDANFRREVHGYTQKLFDRLRASTSSITRATNKARKGRVEREPFPKECLVRRKPHSNGSNPDTLIESLRFVQWYVRFLECELRPTASYQRRIMALQSLIIVLRSGIDSRLPHSHLSKAAQGDQYWIHDLQMTKSTLIRSLLDLVLDPFDDIRSAAISVLQLCLLAASPVENDSIMRKIPDFITRAEYTMLLTGRADQADGVARLWSFVFSMCRSNLIHSKNLHLTSSLDVFEHLQKQLAETLTVVRENLSSAVNGRPIHGTFAALRYTIDQDNFYQMIHSTSATDLPKWQHSHNQIVSSIEGLWSCIQHVLCADAPEGHIPEDVDEDAGLDTKEILSYSWRGLKEASVLLRTIATKAPIGGDNSDFLTPEAFERLGNLCFVQLLELRHRGAFSTVAQTFVAFCRRCTTSNIPALMSLPERWYTKTLASIEDKADAITRRSAGIPALMVAIITAKEQAGGASMARALQDLTTVASQEAQSANIEESRLPQVHALNCIKEIFVTSRLSVASEAYIGQGVELAAKMLNSSIWPIRNCGLMLFKALIERLLGSDEAQDWKERERNSTSRFSYSDYPTLVSILFDLLNADSLTKQATRDDPSSNVVMDLQGAEGVFPALQILRQARPPDEHVQMMIESVKKLLADSHWHMRDMAARTVVSLHTSNQLLDAALSMLRKLPARHNLQHGILLTVRYLLRKFLSKPGQFNIEDLVGVMNDTTTAANRWFTSNRCPSIRSAFLEIISLCGVSALRNPDFVSALPAWETLTASVCIGPQYELHAMNFLGNALYTQSLARVFFLDRIIVRDSTLRITVAKGYQSIGDALKLLADDDADACLVALETIQLVLKPESWNAVTMPLSLVLAHVHRLILDTKNAEVLSKAQSVLGDAFEHDSLRRDFLSLVTEDQLLVTLEKLEQQCLYGSPSGLQTALLPLAAFLDFEYAMFPEHHSTVRGAIARYIRISRWALIDTNPFDIRFAAVQSIKAFDAVFAASPRSKGTGTLILGLSTLLIDFLNDDDDEIRASAAESTARLLSGQSKKAVEGTVPLLASHQLARFLTKQYKDSGYLVKEALRRLTRTPAHAQLFSVPLSAQLADARKEDTALFATEKQNLYRDDALDAVYWSRILVALDASAVEAPIQAGLSAWTLGALTLLRETATTETDGALGWTSKVDVFALGIGAICAAEVLIAWNEGGEDVLLALRQLADALLETDGHGLWTDRIERVLERWVTGRMELAKAGFDRVRCTLAL